MCGVENGVNMVAFAVCAPMHLCLLHGRFVSVGQPSFFDRLGAAIALKLPWSLPVLAILKEPSFDNVYTATDVHAHASASAGAMVPAAGGRGEVCAPHRLLAVRV